MKIALCGPPQSGKSVLRERLKTEIRRLALHLYPLVLSTNPDGEGAWFQAAFQRDPERARTWKTAAKRPWTPERAGVYANWVRNVTEPLVFLDLGGIPDDFNRMICAHASHAILLARDEAGLDAWRTLAADTRLVVLAELISDYHGADDHIVATTPHLSASVHRLERGELDTPRPTVTALAAAIVAACGEAPESRP